MLWTEKNLTIAQRRLLMEAIEESLTLCKRCLKKPQLQYKLLESLFVLAYREEDESEEELKQQFEKGVGERAKILQGLPKEIAETVADFRYLAVGYATKETMQLIKTYYEESLQK